MSKQNNRGAASNASAAAAGNSKGAFALDLNSRLDDGQLFIRRGSTVPVPLPVFHREIEETTVREGTARSMPRPLTVMLDKGAPGLRCAVVGGPKCKVEHLAELAVAADVVGDIADHLADVELVRRVNDALIRGNMRYKSGVLTLDFLSLHRAVQRAVGGSMARTDPKWIVGRVLAEFFSRAYEKMGVMVTFVGGLELEWRLDPVADSDTLINASRVATVTEVFEAIQLGSAFDGVKEFNPAITETLMGPLLASAANKLHNSFRYDQYMRDTRTMVGMRLINPSFLPTHMQDNPDLEFLSTNASFALGALNHATDAILTPDFELREAVVYTVMRLREMKRFETWTLERFASHYGVEQVLSPSGYNAGVYVYRREEIKPSGQITRFMERGDVVMQQPSEVAEAFMSPYFDAISGTLGADVVQRTVSVAAQHVIVGTHQQFADGAGGSVYGFNMTERELMMLALAHSKTLTIGGIGATIDSAHDPVIYYEVADLKAFYESRGLPNGSGMSTTDPAEVLILAQVKNNDPAPFPVRPQTIMDDMRNLVLSQIPEEFTVNGDVHPGVIALDKTVKVELPALDGAGLVRQESLQDLIGLSGIGKLHLTVELELRRHVSAGFAALCDIYNKLAAGSGAQPLHARQVAVSMYSMLSTLAKHSAFLPMMRTIMRRFVNDPAFAAQRTQLRDHFQQDYVKHNVALNTAFMLLLKSGLLEFGVHEDMIKIFDAETVIDIAVTAEHWQAALSQRV